MNEYRYLCVLLRGRGIEWNSLLFYYFFYVDTPRDQPLVEFQWKAQIKKK